MKLTDMKVELVKIPLKKPFRIAFAVQDHSVNVLVKLVTDEGVWGIGEAAPFEPVTGENASTVMEVLRLFQQGLIGRDPMDIEGIHQMMDKYAKKDRGIRILELENSFQLCTKKEMYEYLIRIAKQPKKYVLTDVLLETLSIIAYKQPVTKLEVEKIRGVKSDHAVNKLVEYNLVCEVGRMEAPGRPLLFGTTEEFLRRFSIQSVEELPTMNPEQVETLKTEAEEEVQLKLDI